MSDSAMSIDQRVNLPLAVPLYVVTAFNRAVPKGQRSAVVTSLICRHLGIPEPMKEMIVQ